MTINSNTTLAKTNISDEQNCGSQYLYASDFFFFFRKSAQKNSTVYDLTFK